MVAALLSVRQVAERLSLSERACWELIRRGHLESVTIGRSRRVPVDALDAFLSRLRSPGRAT